MNQLSISYRVRTLVRALSLLCTLSVAIPASHMQAWTLADAARSVAGYFSPRAAQFVEDNKRAVNITIGVGLVAVTGYALFTYLKAKSVAPKAQHDNENKLEDSNLDKKPNRKNSHSLIPHYKAELAAASLHNNIVQQSRILRLTDCPQEPQKELSNDDDQSEEEQQQRQQAEYKKFLSQRIAAIKVAELNEEEYADADMHYAQHPQAMYAQAPSLQSIYSESFLDRMQRPELRDDDDNDDSIEQIEQQNHAAEFDGQEISHNHEQDLLAEELANRDDYHAVDDASKKEQSTVKVPYHHRHRKPKSGLGLKLRHERLKSFSERLAEARKNNLAQKVHRVESVTVPEQMTLSMFSPDAREHIVERQKEEILRMSNDKGTEVVKNLIDKVESFERRLSQLQAKNDKNSQQLAMLAEDLIAASLKTIDSLGEFSHKKMHKEFIAAAQQYNRIHEIMSSTLELKHPITAAYLGEIKDTSVANSCKSAWKGMLELSHHAKSLPVNDNDNDTGIQSTTWQLLNNTTHQAWDTTISTLKASARSVTDFVNDPKTREVAAEVGNAVIAFGGQLVSSTQSLVSAGINTLTSRFAQEPSVNHSQQSVDDLEREFIDEDNKK